MATQDTVTQMIAAVRREVPGAVGIEPRSNRNLRTFWAQTAAQPTVSRCEPDMALLATTFLLTLEVQLRPQSAVGCACQRSVRLPSSKSRRCSSAGRAAVCKRQAEPL